MRFRSKLGPPLLIVFLLGLSSVLQLLSFHGERKPIVEVCLALTLVLLSAAFLAFKYTYWELTPNYLLVRRLWRRRRIPWTEVTEVGWMGTMSGTFRINVGHRIEDYDRLYMEPSDHARFREALQRLAPHAKFDLD